MIKKYPPHHQQQSKIERKTYYIEEGNVHEVEFRKPKEKGTLLRALIAMIIC
jgi:hypothetical protein